MKTLVIALALIGLTGISGRAQNTKDCPCRNKSAHHKVVAAHHRTQVYAHEPASLPPYITVLAHVPNLTQQPAARVEPCYTYRQHNIVVQECPATIYREGNIQYSRDGSYMGYYPDARDENVNSNIAPQHTTINNYKGIAPADGNSCIGCSPQ